MSEAQILLLAHRIAARWLEEVNVYEWAPAVSDEDLSDDDWDALEAAMEKLAGDHARSAGVAP